MGRSLWAKISGGRGRPCGIVFGLYKTRHILLSNGENYIVLRAVVLTQYRRVTDRQTDRQTDGIAIASTALALRAFLARCKKLSQEGVRKTWVLTLSRGVKKLCIVLYLSTCHCVHSQKNRVRDDRPKAPFTRYNLLSNWLSNRIDNRLYRVNGV